MPRNGDTGDTAPRPNSTASAAPRSAMGGGSGSHAPRERRDARQGAVVSFVVASLILLGAFLAAPLLDATPFWRDHFPDQASRIGLLVYAPLFLLGVAARTWRPLTWESELFAQGAKALAHVGLFWWFLVPLLAAPRLAALAVFPLLMATPLTSLLVARRAHGLVPAARRWLLSAPPLAAIGGLVITAVIWNDPPLLLFAAATGLLAAGVVAFPPLAVDKARRIIAQEATPGDRDDARSGFTLETHPLDLGAGTLRPPRGLLALVVALAGLFVVVFIVAPGLPLTAPIAWGALVVALPLVARALLARHGVVHPRAIPGPAAMRRHESRVAPIGDETLQDLDDAAARFLAWGRGRKALAQRMADLLEPADPRATTKRIEARLAGLPRWPWARRAREDGLVRLLRGGDFSGQGGGP